MTHYSGYKKAGSVMPVQDSYYKERETVQSVLEYAVRAIPERNITKETCETFGVRVALDLEKQEKIIAVYFPYYDKKGVLCGWKKRDYTKQKGEEGHFTAIGRVSSDCKLFGQQVAESQIRKRTKLDIVEGEFDVLSAYQAQTDAFKNAADEKWQSLKPFVVGLQIGTANASDSVAHNIDFVKSFPKIVLGLDNDEATPKEKSKGIKKGREAAEDIFGVLMRDDVFVARFSGNHKDPSDFLQAGDSDALARAFTTNIDKFVADKIVTAAEIGFEAFIRPRVKGIKIASFPELNEKIQGFRKRELVIVTSPSGVGKSTFTSEIAYSLADPTPYYEEKYNEDGEVVKELIEPKPQRVGMIFLEETKEETLQRMGARYLKRNFNTFRHDPSAAGCSNEQLLEAYNWCKENDKFVFLDHFGSIQIEELMNKLKTLVHVNKCDYIILDHLSMCISGLKESDERKLLDMVMTELAAFCASTDVGIIAVTHINRSGAGDFKAPKDNKDEPFWVEVTKEQMRGSAALEQLSWIVLGIEPEIMPDKSRGRVRIVVLKNRPWGLLGRADVLYMSPSTGLLETAPEVVVSGLKSAFSGQEAVGY